MVGGVGNGVFECVQELVGYENLCYMSIDNPDLYRDLFNKMGKTIFDMWVKFLRKFSDIFCVLRFGDDLGYRLQTLLSTSDIRLHILPWYKQIVDLIHSYEKPFLFHSCGKIFSIMTDLITHVGINANHSNEDQILHFENWIEMYGAKIALFGGIDTDILCCSSIPELRSYLTDFFCKCFEKKDLHLVREIQFLHMYQLKII